MVFRVVVARAATGEETATTGRGAGKTESAAPCAARRKGLLLGPSGGGAPAGVYGSEGAYSVLVNNSGTL